MASTVVTMTRFQGVVASAKEIAAMLVDPIVGELTEALAALDPTTPNVPFYSATSYDPRDDPSCDARYWASNMRRMVRFSAAVRAAAVEAVIRRRQGRQRRRGRQDDPVRCGGG